MQNVVLVIHLFLALALIGIVLLQRSEGGGLGMGGGAAGGTMTGRSAANAMTKLTWGLAVAFICTSLALTVIASSQSGGSSVVDTLPVTPDATAPTDGTELLPPSSDGAGALTPVAE